MSLTNNPTQQQVVTEVKRLETDKANLNSPSLTGTPTINNVTIATVNNIPSVPSAGTTVTAVGTSSSAGSATTWSKSDHTHNITGTTITSALGFTPGAITGITMNGASKGTSGVVDLGTVVTDVSGKANKSGDTFTGEITINTGTTQSATKGIKWSAINSRNPYIGYALDQNDGTFLVGSLLGTSYANGLAIGGGSGNLLWKSSKVMTAANFTLVDGVLTITT